MAIDHPTKLTQAYSDGGKKLFWEIRMNLKILLKKNKNYFGPKRWSVAS